MALRNTAALAALISLAAFGASCSGAKDHPISINQYARFYARYALISDTYKDNRDSLQACINGLYASEELTPEQIHLFVRSHEENPEEYSKIQEAIVEELERLNPRKAQDR
ncbi:MAG: hypothetical protein A2268_05500 [Candidatus Raymondbacteria bacterium RifOxyA12_full_50_37]|uniref:DUF4296 domain-containing protein n=1 Tax=Candidatus Raymondbacteria bacterium RIFOXYD12_FULL_49_13 TaxID=1817890 RepID=A0A1F7FBP4_UNCRA|nr:MAG: hypothetical protein A2268_05500 [Candidatus Raymondbacteria bacterium RifOxyA12_full_50_37]OGJ89020.1 MAG: hypothetical protein A2248_02735 [Candidatus Raymondbacteria bacterium RIFOXYA2_FULL_49_16]OGJ97047.1 MAG: hypothetical protein A2453_04150 [Candidatus Raymondbacteria bacterium RIFOXYC2_FULL_50_21]OGJ97867.1 MAG: hypothetical protein A2487_02260 [Candidatus Raymondbacteria bacterium RifOxyC12_full_50_8]OGK04043.1 MAG: hypothetical protein A2519_00890 [Candidatus Raymondbacteria b